MTKEQVYNELEQELQMFEDGDQVMFISNTKIATLLCNYFSTDEIIEFTKWLKTEC